MHDSQHVAVIDFGSQYTQLIVRRVRELGFFAKLYAIEDFPDIGKPGAIILSGGPRSTSEPDAPDLDFEPLAVEDRHVVHRLMRSQRLTHFQLLVSRSLRVTTWLANCALRCA